MSTQAYNSTPSRPVAQSTKTDIQQLSVQYLAVHDVNNCYFVTEETDKKERNIFTVLHEELPECFQLCDDKVESILTSLRHLSVEPQECTPELHEKSFWDEMCHLQDTILKTIEKDREGDSSTITSNILVDALVRARCRVFSLGRNRRYLTYFPKTKVVPWKPDICLMQLPTEEQAKKVARDDKKTVRSKEKPPAGNKKIDSMAWGSIGTIFEHKTNSDLSKPDTTEAKYRLILRGSAVLMDNPFRLFVPLILICGVHLTLLICDRSGVREYPTIDIDRGDGLVQWVRLVGWLLFATPEQLGFFQSIGLMGKPTDCTVWIPTVTEDKARQFKIIGDPFVHVTSNAINHRATVVYRAKEVIREAEENRPEELGKQELVLKVSWPHVVRTFEGDYLRSMEKHNIRNVARMVAGARVQTTDSNSRGFRMSKVTRSNSGLTNQGRGPIIYSGGSLHVTSVRLLPAGNSSGNKRKRNPIEETPTKKKTPKTTHTSTLHPDDNELRAPSTFDLEFAENNTATNAHNIYMQAIRALTLIVMPDYGIPLDSAHHRDGTEISHSERLLACRNTIDAIADLYIHAITEMPEDFPGMHRDISCGNIMIPSPGSDPNNSASLIDFDFAAFCNKRKDYFSSGAPHRTGTRVSMAMALLMPKGSDMDPVPHHRPFFDMESVFWSLYIAVLGPIITSDRPPNHFADQINRFCAEDQRRAGHEKYDVLTEEWKISEELIRRHDLKAIIVVWSLLDCMRRYLFLKEPKAIPKEDWEEDHLYCYYTLPRFNETGAHKHTLRPWGDSCDTVDEVRKTLKSMLLAASNALAEIPIKE